MLPAPDQVHLYISGDVTGVGYRFWAQQEARQLKITGWVRNQTTGVVEILAQGVPAAVEQFISRCRQGPDVCWVRSVDVQMEPLKTLYSTFDIIS